MPPASSDSGAHTTDDARASLPSQQSQCRAPSDEQLASPHRLADDVLAELEADRLGAAGALFVDVVADHLARATDRTHAVTTGLSQAALAARFDSPLPRRGRPLRDVVARLAGDVAADAIRLSHPMYMGHQIGAPLPAAVWTEAVIGALNQAMTVAEMSPTATALETRLVRGLADLIGFSGDAGGHLTSGGTEATFTALLAARAHAMPDAWTGGIPADPPVVVCGEHAHYSTTRAVAELGLGTDRVIPIPSHRFRMDVDALAKMLRRLERQGRSVMAVVAAAGSTPTGAFDDLEAIGAICDARGVWLHVDAAQGGTALLSAAHRGRLSGIARARTVAWDPHKAMLIPISAGMLLARDEHDLDAAFAQRAPYLFHGALGEPKRGKRATDTGVRSFLCARRADALKLWVALERHGTDGLAALYERMCAVTRALYEQVEASESFETLHEPECNILCFRWVGNRTDAPDRLDALNGALRERYNASGRGWITGTVLDGRRVLRVTIANPRTTPADTQALLDGLSAAAREPR